MSDPAEQALLDLAARLAPGSQPVARAVAEGAAELKALVERHYSETSTGGWRKSHVSGGQVGITAGTTGAAVSIDSKELAHLIRGGTVRPTAPRKALAIPLTAEARAAGNPSNKRIPDVFHPKGTRILARKRADGALEALWALCAQVTHRAHPEYAPDMAAAADSVKAAIDRSLRRQFPEID